jgi:hypothetical protein
MTSCELKRNSCSAKKQIVNPSSPRVLVGERSRDSSALVEAGSVKRETLADRLSGNRRSNRTDAPAAPTGEGATVTRHSTVRR